MKRKKPTKTELEEMNARHADILANAQRTRGARRTRSSAARGPRPEPAAGVDAFPAEPDEGRA
jgi:hypothetical protein